MKDVNIKYFQVFVRVYELESITAAADELFLTQPAVSRIIRELEEKYETRFFHRHSGRIFRTEGGRRFYPLAKQLLHAAEQIDDSMEDQRSRHKVHIGATPTIANYYLPAILEKYRIENNHLNIYLHVYPESTLEEMIRDSLLDFAISEGVHNTQDVRAFSIYEDRVVFVAKEDYEIPEVLPLLIRDIGHQAQQILEEQLLAAGRAHDFKGHFVDVEGILQYAARGFGIGVLPEGALKESHGLKEIEILSIMLKNTVSLMHHRQKFIFPELKEMFEFLEKEMGNK